MPPRNGLRGHVAAFLWRKYYTPKVPLQSSLGVKSFNPCGCQVGSSRGRVGSSQEKGVQTARRAVCRGLSILIVISVVRKPQKFVAFPLQKRRAPEGARESAEPAIGGDGDPHVRAVERSHFVEDIGGEDDEITRAQPEIQGTQGKRGVQIFDGRVQVCARSLARVEEAQDCALRMI